MNTIILYEHTTGWIFYKRMCSKKFCIIIRDTKFMTIIEILIKWTFIFICWIIVFHFKICVTCFWYSSVYGSQRGPRIFNIYIPTPRIPYYSSTSSSSKSSPFNRHGLGFLSDAVSITDSPSSSVGRSHAYVANCNGASATLTSIFLMPLFSKFSNPISLHKFKGEKNKMRERR